ncbi:mite allergen Der p 3-like isoform X2 [Photinus pyralis]|uniref:mite allergen Der p 3-like isoform X2 n=1 Tax=Photinus pyralis TaxID=7054 RepID=UPI0012670D88|nr:mite allergen Der p 3-like isoform X2 [Photinus pyralis]
MTALRFLTLFLYFSVFCHWGLSVRIIGGRPGYLPYQASLRLRTGSNHFCGGTIIGPFYILTAGHCIVIQIASRAAMLNPRAIFVVVGQTELEMMTNSTKRNVAKIVVHKDFHPGAAENDIALLRLNSELPLSPEMPINAIPLNTDHLKAGETCVASGWGSIQPSPTKLNHELHLVDVHVFTLNKCSSMYRVAGVTLHPGMLCAGSYAGGKDACQVFYTS